MFRLIKCLCVVWLALVVAHAGRVSAASPEAEVVLAKQAQLRGKLCKMLGIPTARVRLEPEYRGRFERDGIVIEKWIWTAEPGSRVPSILYRPKKPAGKMPAIVLTYGHGGSKSTWQYNYSGQVYAKLGLACLAIDPIGEEERNIRGRLGTRAHDPKAVSNRADKAGRLIMGKLVFDTMRAIDFLMTRKDTDHERIGIGGNSLGGATAGWVSVIDKRVKMSIVSGWAFDDITIRTKFCTRLPNQRMRKLCSWAEYVSLAAPHCAMLVTNGDADVVIDRNNDGTAWAGTRANLTAAAPNFKLLGAEGKIDYWFERGGGHRPYHVYKIALEWIHRHLGTPAMSADEIRALPTINAGKWCDRNNYKLERLYGTKLHSRGATLPDFGLRLMRQQELAVLRPDEIGKPQYTIEGWLEQIEKRDR